MKELYSVQMRQEINYVCLCHKCSISLAAALSNYSKSLNEVKAWFKQNVEPKGQVWGKRNSYVAPGPYHEYQADLFFITASQFENQEYKVGLSMIDVFCLSLAMCHKGGSKIGNRF